MSAAVRRALTWFVPLSMAASAVALHEEDPKMRSRSPAHMGRSVRTNAPAGQSMAGAGTARAFPANNVRMLSWLTLSDFGVPSSGNANVCWGYVSPSGTNYALVGLSTGTGFVRLTDPSNPEIITVMSGPQSLWRDVRVFGQYAYAVSEGGQGVQVFNLAQIDNDVITLAGTFATTGTTATHTVWIDTDSGFLYRAGGGSNGLRIYDLNQSATNPPQVGTWSNFYVHEVCVKTYTSGPYAGRQIAFCCSGSNGGGTNTGLRVLDVTNKASIVQLDDVFWPNPGYSHQIDLSSDLQYAYINDELDEGSTVATTRTIVVNISNLSNLTLAGTFSNGNTAIGHNNYVKGNQLYCANYRSGLRVFDLANPLSPTEIAYFDTWDSDDAAEFNGLWLAYPYLPNGVILGSDIEKGLFVWWVGAPLVDVQLTQSAPSLISPAGQTIGAVITESQAGLLVAGSERLNYDAGAGTVSVPLANLGNGNYDVSFPALNCGSTVSWYLSAQSTNGLTWTYPESGAAAPVESTVAYASTITTQLDMETASGWTSGDTGDNATSGQWTRVDPNGTAAQPEDDHSVTGGVCWVTGNAAAGASVGTADVDGGTTTLKTAVYDLTGYSDPVIGYWRWYSNNQNGVVDDTFYVQVSNGGLWNTVETVGPSSAEAQGGWYYHEFHVNQFVAPSATVQVRFRASDLGTGSIVEAAIDDFVIRNVDCSTLSVYCTAGTTSSGCNASISASGVASATSAAGFTLDISQVEGAKTGLIFYGVNGQLSNPWNGGSSYLCVRAPTQRLSPQATGGTSGACNGSLSVDWNAYRSSHPSALGAPFGAGDVVWSQAWFRDPPSPGTTSMSNALRFTVGP
ncbi:MAG: choice-of-anchor B family protein [Planctomycetes bacterium]|nr:choice-of-anchor B family protein [Planctomycetota bacterium]